MIGEDVDDSGPSNFFHSVSYTSYIHTYAHTYIHTYIYLISRFERNCTADVDLLLLSLED